jgi:hypothetical protein
MPEISRFFGIVIYVHFNDHSPPHFHAKYGEDEALYEITTLRIYRGRLGRRVHSMVIEWADTHRTELMENWVRAQQGQPVVAIEPLE